MERIRIGFPVPLSSVYGTEAQEQARCAQIAVEEFNASGGLDSREAEILVRDTKHNSDLTKSIAMELIEKERVQFMVGALSAIDMLTLSQVCSERKMIYNGISVGDGIVSRAHRSRYVFHEGPTAFGTADSIGRYAYCHYGFRVAFLTVNSA
ncbi:MAG: ABC transporter substrate-binding protein, partial [Bdellovibrio sp.]